MTEFEMPTRSPYDTLISILSNIEVENTKGEHKHGFLIIEPKKFSLEGALPEGVFDALLKQPITSIRNYTFKESNEKIIEKDTTDAFFKRTKSKEGIIPKPMDVWMVKFTDDTYPGEFGHEHPAIVYDSPAKGLFNVIPCSTKYYEGKQVLKLELYDPDILKDGDEFFMQKSKGKTTYALYQERCPVSSARFIRYLGRIDEAYHGMIHNCYEKVNTNLKANSNDFISVSRLPFNSKQIKLSQKYVDKLDEICNSTFSYEEKVKKILITLGFYPDADEAATYLRDIIIKMRYDYEINLKKTAEKISKHTCKNSSLIVQRINELVKKKYSYIYPCTEDIIELVKMIATARR